MNFSFVFKTIFSAMFIFIIIYSLSLVSVQNDLNDHNNIMSKNITKESLNIGELRVNNSVSFDNDYLLKSTLENYAKNNNLNVDKVKFDIAVNNDIVTIKIYTYKNMFEIDSDSIEVFSYQVVKEE